MSRFELKITQDYATIPLVDVKSMEIGRVLKNEVLRVASSAEQKSKTVCVCMCVVCSMCVCVSF